MAYHPYSDPVGSGLVQLTPTQRLNNADLYRARRGPGPTYSGSPVTSPLSGLGDTLGAVLHSAGYGQPDHVRSDAQPPSQGVHSDGQDLYHVRDNRDGSTTTTHMGPDGLSSQQEAGA